MIYGARVSMLVGLGAQVIVVLIGVPIGALSGHLGGRVDLVLMRLVDVMYAFPNLLVRDPRHVHAGRGPSQHLHRDRAHRLGRHRPADARPGARHPGEGVRRGRPRPRRGVPARSSSVTSCPNALTPIVVAITFGIPQAIFTEAALSFIGVGINPPTPSWGQMVGEGQQYLRTYWHLCVFPSIAIGLTMLSFTFLGDGIRDALDPKLK